MGYSDKKLQHTLKKPSRLHWTEEKKRNPLYLMDDSLGKYAEILSDKHSDPFISGEQYAGASLELPSHYGICPFILPALLRLCMSHLRFFFFFFYSNGMFRALQLESFYMRLRLRYCSFSLLFFSAFFALPNYSTDAVIHSSIARWLQHK